MATEWRQELDGIEDEWNALADRLGAPPFAYPGWFAAWYAAFGGGQRQLLTVRDGERLAGVLALERRGGVLRAASNWHTPVFGAPCEPAALAELAAAFVASRARRRDLMMLDAADPLVPHVRERAIERVVERQPWVDTSGPWEEYEAGLARKLRKELRRQRRRLEERGEVTVEFAPGGGALEELLGEGFRLEGSGWKTAKGTAIGSDPAVEGFYRSVARWAAGRGWLRLAFLRVAGKPVAFDMQLEAGGAVYVLKGGFDTDWARYSPGSVLTHASLQRAFADPALSSYEFLGSDDSYKLVWTETVRERLRLQSFPASPAGVLDRLAWTYGRPAAKAVVSAVRR